MQPDEARHMKPTRPLLVAMLLAFACGAGNPGQEAAQAPIQNTVQPTRTQARAQTSPQAPGAPDRSSGIAHELGLNGGIPSLAPLIDSVRPSVVGVTVTAKASEGGDVPPEMEEFWHRFFGRDAPPFGGSPGPRTGVGSGVIIDPSGIILTNNHVVEGADQVRIKTADETEYDAEVLGSDPDTDVAVLRIKNPKGKLTAATLGTSDALRVGDFVVAIGNPFGLELTVTSGIISAKARVIGAGPYDDFLQTDAAINPGNSGGPLFDLGGKVVGINTAIVATGSGIGFAVPIDLVKALLPQLQEKGRVVRGFLGVGVQDLTPELAKAMNLPTSKGALVAQVQRDAPARKLEPGDVVTGLDGQAVTNASELTRRVAQLPPGRTVKLQVLRRGKQQTVEVKLGERPGADQNKREQPSKGGEGALGLQIQPVPPELRRELGVSGGVMISGVQAGSRAEQAGLQPGDVILEANRKAVNKPEDLINAAKAAGKNALLLRVARGDAAVFIVVPAE